MISSNLQKKVIQAKKFNHMKTPDLISFLKRCNDVLFCRIEGPEQKMNVGGNAKRWIK